MKSWQPRTVLAIFLAVAVSIALLRASFEVGGWWRDVLLNTSFVVIAALFTALIVDQAIRRHDEARWRDATEFSWTRLRRLCTMLISAIAQYYPDPSNTSNSRSLIPRAQAHIDTDQLGHYLYSDAKWVRHVRVEAIPNYSQVIDRIQADELEDLVRSLRSHRAELKDSLILFSQFLTPTQLSGTLRIIDSCAKEEPLLEILRNTRHNNVTINHVAPNLSPILEDALEIVEEVNRRYPPGPRPK